MPITPLSSTLSQETSSSDGNNVKATLKPVSHLFVEDTGVAFSQTDLQSFGMKSLTQFRTTSKITFSGTRKVYAICQGQIFIQPNADDPAKINLILRPYKQPINELPIKYFIYRGLNKSDFVTSDPTPLFAGSETTGTDLNKNLWKQFNDFYNLDTSGDPTPSFLADYLGYPSASFVQTGSDLIDEYFFKKTEYTDVTNTVEEVSSSFELPIIPRGLYIGNANAEVGIDVVLNNGDYYYDNGTIPFKYDLDYAKSGDHVLDVSNGTTAYEEKLIKEAAINFLDIVAFYGMHANGTGKLYTNDIVTPLSTKSDVYGKLTNFYSKNTQYVYIYGNRQRSYNFYNEHVHPDTGNNNSIAIGDSVATLTEDVFGTNGWPIHTLSNYETLVLQLITDNNENSALNVRIGNINSEHSNNFIYERGLLQDLEDTIVTNEYYTQPIELKFEEDGGAAISGFAQLIYDGITIGAYEAGVGTTLGEIKGIDNVFGLLGAKSFIKNITTNESNTLTGYDVQLTKFGSYDASNIFGTVKTKRINDVILEVDPNTIRRVTYETLLNSIKSSSSPYLKTTDSTFDNSVAKSEKFEIEINNYYVPTKPYWLKKMVFTDGGVSVKGLVLSHANGDITTKKMLGLTELENTELETIVITNTLNNARFYFNNLLESEEDFYLTGNNIKYRAYKLGITGEAIDGTLNIYYPASDITIYTIDELIYFSKPYTDNIPIHPDLITINNFKPELP